MMSYRAATRLRCNNCHTELIVLKPGKAPLTCCGSEMEIVSATTKGRAQENPKEGGK